METITFMKQDADCSVNEIGLIKNMREQLKVYVASNTGKIAKGISLNEKNIHIEDVDDEEAQRANLKNTFDVIQCGKCQNVGVIGHLEQCKSCKQIYCHACIKSEGFICMTTKCSGEI